MSVAFSDAFAVWTKELAAVEEAIGRYAAWRAHGRLAEPIQYALAGKGKRIRPLLCLLTAQAVGGKSEAALPAAVSLELVHIYSLIHDDLPCMDDDDLRRGRPTVHKAFDEPTALLVGDALLAEAYLALTRLGAQELGVGSSAFDAARAMVMVEELSQASGARGMVEGQALDLYWTARQGASRDVLDELHLKKTGALLGAAAAMGALAGGADSAVVDACRLFGQRIGLVFQIIDDLLDDAETTGKSAGKDKDVGKLTYATTMRREDAQAVADQLTAEATRDFEAVVPHPEPVIKLSRLLLHRDY